MTTSSRPTRATPVGDTRPVTTAVVAPVSGSTRVTLPASDSATKRYPSPNRSPKGPFKPVATTVTGSSRVAWS